MKQTLNLQTIYLTFAFLLLSCSYVVGQISDAEVKANRDRLNKALSKASSNYSDYLKSERHSQSNLNDYYKFHPSWPVGTPGPGGGIIAYFDKDDKYDFEFLEMAPENWYGTEELPQLLWQPFSCIDKLNLCEEVGCGITNTRQIIQHCAAEDIEAVRAVLSYNGNEKKDWFLPSYDELKEISKNVGIKSIAAINVSPAYKGKGLLTSNFNKGSRSIESLKNFDEYYQGNEEDYVELKVGIFSDDVVDGFSAQLDRSFERVTIRKNHIRPNDKAYILPVRTTNWNELSSFWNTMDVANKKELFDKAMDLYYNKYEDSDEILLLLAKSGTLPAQIQFAICLHLWGDNFYKNYASRIIDHNFNKLILSAKTGNTDAQFLVGRIYCINSLGQNNPKEGLVWLNKAAEKGNQYAMGFLADVYYNGLYNIEKDIKKASVWAEKAKNINNTLGITTLGLINNDYNTLKKASELGCPKALYSLGKIILNRKENSVEDWEKGYGYLKKSAKKLYQPAIDDLHSRGYRFMFSVGSTYEWKLDNKANEEFLFYKQVLSLKTVDALRLYQEEYPEGRFYNDVETRIEYHARSQTLERQIKESKKTLQRNKNDRNGQIALGMLGIVGVSASLYGVHHYGQQDESTFQAAALVSGIFCGTFSFTKFEKASKYNKWYKRNKPYLYELENEYSILKNKFVSYNISPQINPYNGSFNMHLSLKF